MPNNRLKWLLLASGVLLVVTLLVVITLYNRKPADEKGKRVDPHDRAELHSLSFNGKDVLGEKLVALKVGEEILVSASWHVDRPLNALVTIQFQDDRFVIFNSAAASANIQNGEMSIEEVKIAAPAVPGRYSFSISIQAPGDPSAPNPRVMKYVAKLLVEVQ